jgi:hypothetical protein
VRAHRWFAIVGWARAPGASGRNRRPGSSLVVNPATNRDGSCTAANRDSSCDASSYRVRPASRRTADDTSRCLGHAAVNTVFGFLHPHTTGISVLDAESDFLRARRAYRFARVRAWLRRCGSCRRLRSLSPTVLLAAGPTRLEVVPLHAVVGAVESTVHFDSDFRPASNALRRRWERIALAHRQGEPLPPVVLRQQPEGYYVVHGRHRISVARALRHRDIDAWVSGPRQ